MSHSWLTSYSSERDTRKRTKKVDTPLSHSFLTPFSATPLNHSWLTSSSLQRDVTRQAEKVDDGGFEDVHKELRLSLPQITHPSDQDLNNLLHDKKLYLVLDLDHTLLHTVPLSQLTAEETYVDDNVGFPESVYAMNNYKMTKLRPFVHSFLKKASKLFDMYICTLGNRAYALDMLKLLDPENIYFNNGSKVISREDCPGDIKSLDIFLRNKDAAVVILDDTKEVWKSTRNLIVADRYHYFEQSLKYYHKDENLKSYSVLNTDESESTGTLATTLSILQRLHAEFFNVDDQKDLEHQDVRLLLSTMLERPV